MSDKDQEARELARGIAQWAAPEELVGDESAERNWLEGAIRQWEVPILVMLDKREATLQAQLARALGELAELREALGRFLQDAALHVPDGVAASWMLRVDKAFASSPLSERAAAVILEAGRLVDDARDRDVSPTVEGWSCERLIHAVDALRAELANGGEGG